MHRWFGHIRRLLFGAMAVGVVGVLLVQHLPVRSLAQHLAGAPGHGCTKEVCHHDATCTCSLCDHGATGASPSPEDRSAIPPSGGPAVHPCGSPRSEAPGILVVSKSLLPRASLAATVVHARASASRFERPALLVPQEPVDRLLRPPQS